MYPHSFLKNYHCKLLTLLAVCMLYLSDAHAGKKLAAGTLDTRQSNYQENLDMLLASENHPAILEFIDSLRVAGHYNKQLSWQYARSLFQAGRFDSARDSLLSWEQDSLFRTRAENMMVQIAAQQGDHMEAVKYLIRLRDRYPYNPIYPHRLARVFIALNQLPAAEGQYALAFRLDTLNQPVIGEWADVLQKLESPERAYRILRRGVAVSPENLNFRRQMVGLTYKMRRPEEVIEHASFLTLLGDTTAQSVKLKAFALFQMDSLERAEYWLDYLLDNQLYGEDVYFYKGRILATRGQKEEAQLFYDQSVSSCLSPNFNNFAMQAGINLYETLKFEDAIRWMQMLRNFSDNPMVLFYLASTYYLYYEDQEPALRNFHLFLEQSWRDEEETYREYARSRIREINEGKHFEGL
jgi:predicted Zn-dependent protease